MAQLKFLEITERYASAASFAYSYPLSDSWATFGDTTPTVDTGETLVGYFVSQTDGNDSYDGTEQTHTTGTTGPWKTVAKVNAATFSPDDHIYFKRGDVWRETLTIPSSGTSDHVITFGAYGSGAKPIINAADIFSSWTGDSSDYYTAKAAQPSWVVYDGAVLKPVALRASLATGKWWWDSGNSRVYIRDNPSGHTVEASVRARSIYAGQKNYLTVDNLEMCYGNDDGIEVFDSTDWIITNNYCHHVGMWDEATADCIKLQASNALIANNQITYGGDHGIYVVCGSNSVQNVVVEHNVVLNSGHTGIDCMFINGTAMSDITVRYNEVYWDTDFDPAAYNPIAIYISSDTAGKTLQNVAVYYNLIHDCIQAGIGVGSSSGAVKNINIRNNTIYGTLSTSTRQCRAMGISSTVDGTGTNTCQNNIMAVRTVNDSAVTVGDGADWTSFSNNLIYLLPGSTHTGRIWFAANPNDATYYDAATFIAAMGGKADGSIFGDPLLNGDYTLQGTSPCINAGIDVGLTEDYNGDPISGAPDMGAFES